MMLRKFALKDGSGTVDLCKDHRPMMADQVGPDQGRVVGAKWKCSICTSLRALAGEKKDADVTHINGYVIVCTPTGATYCTCPAWRNQKRPSNDRTCKHIDQVYGEAD